MGNLYGACNNGCDNSLDSPVYKQYRPSCRRHVNQSSRENAITSVAPAIICVTTRQSAAFRSSIDKVEGLLDSDFIKEVNIGIYFLSMFCK